VTAFLEDHPTPAPPAEVTTCGDVRAVLSIVPFAVASQAERHTLDRLSSVPVLVRATSPRARGEIAIDGSGWGSKSFKDEDGTRNLVAIIVRCADVDTCRAALSAAERPPVYAAGDAARVPFLVCGAPSATIPWGKPQPIRAAP
jgi:hypothetical protein